MPQRDAAHATSAGTASVVPGSAPERERSRPAAPRPPRLRHRDDRGPDAMAPVGTATPRPARDAGPDVGPDSALDAGPDSGPDAGAVGGSGVDAAPSSGGDAPNPLLAGRSVSLWFVCAGVAAAVAATLAIGVTHGALVLAGVLGLSAVARAVLRPVALTVRSRAQDCAVLGALALGIGLLAPFTPTG